MKHIIKNPEPSVFSTWKQHHPDAVYADLKRSNKSAKAANSDLRKSLVKEQHHLCCYCECHIGDDDFHIEHFKPKDPNLFPELQLEYKNLHACCHVIPVGGEDESCGHKKGNYYSADLISPLEADCGSHFSYLMDGSMKGLDSRGELTIEKLNLNSSLLCESRKKLIDYFINDVSEESLDFEIQSHLDLNKEEYEEFYSMIEQLRSLFL